MRLYAQTLLIVGITVLAVAAVLLVTFELTVMGSFTTLEQEYASQDLHRAENAIGGEISRLSGIARDWAAWDDMYAYLQDRNSSFLSSNFGPIPLRSLNIELIAIYDLNGTLVCGISAPLAGGAAGPIPAELDNLLRVSNLSKAPDEGYSGIIPGIDSPYIVSSYPVLNSRNEGPARGSLVVAELLDERMITTLSHTILQNITMTPVSSMNKGIFVQNNITPSDLSSLATGYSGYIDDIYGRPAVLLQINERRDLSQSGLYSRVFLLTSLLLLTLLFMGLASWLINRIIIAPLQILNHDLIRIGESGSLSGRIKVNRNDEIGDLANSLNLMLISLEEAQRERITSEQRLARLIELVEEGICLIGPDSLIWFANPTLAVIFETTTHALTGTSIQSLLVPEDPEVHLADYEKYGTVFTPGQHEFHSKTTMGRDIWVRVASAPYPLDTGKMGHLCVVTDVTVFRTTERELLLSNKKLALLGSMTRHDIVNQLTTIRGMLGLIKRKNADHALDQLIGSAEDASEKINKHIEFSKEYQKAGIEKPRWQDLRSVWNLAYAMSRRRGLTFTITGNNYEVYADQLLQKVFYNLIDNSLRHGKDIFYITISTRLEGSDLLIMYEDDGGGIPDAMKGRIFDRGVGVGTGWGLFFAREVLDLTGMSINEMGTYGIGALFIIRVPEGVFRSVESEKPDLNRETSRDPDTSDNNQVFSSNRDPEDDPGNQKHDH